MIIKPGVVIICHMILGFICLIGFSVIFSIETKSILWGFLPTIVICLLMLPRCIASARTIIMDENGCTVCLLWYKKTYRWDELKTKRYVSFGDFCFEYRSPVERGAEFCPKAVHRSKKIKSWTYSIRFHPLSFFFVYFPPDPRPKDETLCPIIYEADEDIFRAKMKEWNVEMEEDS